MSRAFPVFAEELRFAFEYASAADPGRLDAGGSLAKSRAVMEKLLLQIFMAEMGSEPTKPLLGEMLKNNQFTRRIERRILARMEAIREWGNLGAHGERVERSDAIKTLDNLCEVLGWHLRRNPTGPETVPGIAPLPPDLASADRTTQLRGCPAAILWGPNSPGHSQVKEIDVLQKAAIQGGVRLIPIILDGVQRDPDCPVLVDLAQRIDFRKRHPDPMVRFIAALMGT